jgi:Na+-translocating ferredoxin:NAD+ oxidoreductase RnfC subunit
MEDMIEKVRRAGVVGAGGAGFPTHVKLEARVEYVIINAAECEPLLAVDQFLVERYGERLVHTARLIATRMGAKKAIFAIKQKYGNAVALLQELTAREKVLGVALLEDVYPAGDEHVAVYEVLGRVVPEGGIPLHVGVVVLNVETLLNISFALEDRPVTHTYCTITGDVAEPITARLPVGMRIREAIALAGNASEAKHVVLDGGPMMGRLVTDWSEPVTKTTKGLIVLPREHYLATRYINVPREVGKNIVSMCCSCVQCTEVCPRYLLGHTIEPQKLMVAAAHGMGRDERIFRMAHYCCECGICELFACFMFLSPRHLIAEMRRDFARRKVKPQPFTKTSRPHPARTFRKVPTSRLKGKLQISKFDRVPRFEEEIQPPVREVLIPLKQHLGAAGTPIVKRGQKVKMGEILSKPAAGGVSAVVHSSIDGTVTEVNERFVRIQGV